MPSQQSPIKGYRDLTAEEVALVNEAKALAETVGAFVEKVRRLPTSRIPPSATEGTSQDPRWVAIGATHLQQGFMALIRSIAKPTTF